MKAHASRKNDNDFPRRRAGQAGRRGWSCDTRATPANGRAEPGRQTIDICVQNGRQKRHPPYYIPLHPNPRNHHVLTPPPYPHPHALSTSLSRMPPKLFNFRTQPLTANQAIPLLLTLFVFPPSFTSSSFLPLFLFFLFFSFFFSLFHCPLSFSLWSSH